MLYRVTFYFRNGAELSCAADWGDDAESLRSEIGRLMKYKASDIFLIGAIGVRLSDVSAYKVRLDTTTN